MSRPGWELRSKRKGGEQSAHRRVSVCRNIRARLFGSLRFKPCFSGLDLSSLLISRLLGRHFLDLLYVNQLRRLIQLSRHLDRFAGERLSLQRIVKVI